MEYLKGVKPQDSLHDSTCELEEIIKNVSGKDPLLACEFVFIGWITQRVEDELCKRSREYFMGDFSRPVLSHVRSYVFHNQCTEQELLGEYYEFITKENVLKNIPYYKLYLYKNRRNTTLRKYVTTITSRYFGAGKIKRDKINRNTLSLDGYSNDDEKNGENLIENPWFNLLISNRGEEKDEKRVKQETYQRIESVLSRLPEREQLIIKLMVMDCASGLEAFEELEPYMKTRAKIPVSTWTVKQKQDAMSLLKARALKHLKTIIDNENINF